MTPEQIKIQFEEWIKKAKAHVLECEVNLAMARANVQALKEEQQRCLSNSRQE